MRACAGAAIVVALSVVVGGTASAACPTHETRGCVVDLSLSPQLSQQIVAGDSNAPPPQTPAVPVPVPVQAIPAYSGPTIGAAPNFGRAPEISYRWSIN
jgi:hypothetical protein